MNTRKLVLIGLFIAISFVGAQIKIVYSIAFDSMPAFAAALLLGPVPGAIVGFLGHMLTSLTSGFPFTIPVHLLIGVSMGAICWLFGKLNQKVPGFLNAAIAILLNGIGATFISVYAMFILGIIPSWNQLFFSLVGVLTLASTINVLVAVVLDKIIGNTGLIGQRS
ncbi:ECF transporter S component [Alkalibacter mobilis]|uniref:ECF transporter S component n=1 Tax=Alkalibacter mobilis TaxID=2787712 RepID=UPI00189EA744|nr:ECF transporter S component [Alkalibacter mobilis]MBF7096883.1 ECF transporter S component [Alkalibacter mobilis]